MTHVLNVRQEALLSRLLDPLNSTTNDTSLAPVVGNEEHNNEPITLQPEKRCITPYQAVKAVRDIHSGLIIVEAKCVEILDEQFGTAQGESVSRGGKLSADQWLALIAAIIERML